MSQAAGKPKNIMATFAKILSRAAEVQGPYADLAIAVIGQAILDSRKCADRDGVSHREARQFLRPGGGADHWCHMIGIRPEFPLEIAMTLGLVPKEAK